MFRLMRGRWFWSVAGIAAAAYLLRRPRRSPVEVLRLAGEGGLADDVMQAGRSVVDAAMKAGRAVGQAIAGEAARILAKR